MRPEAESLTAICNFKQRLSPGIPCHHCETELRTASSPVASTPCGFLEFQLGACSGLPIPNGARPNPSLKRSANGSPPGPVRGERAFSTARAWRATVVSRLAHTLGLACPPLPPRQRFLKLSSARSAGQVLSRLSASTSGSGVACEARAPHRNLQRQATLVARRPPPFAGSTAGVKQSSGAHALRLSGTSARGEQWHAQPPRCKA